MDRKTLALAGSLTLAALGGAALLQGGAPGAPVQTPAEAALADRLASQRASLRAADAGVADAAESRAPAFPLSP